MIPNLNLSVRNNFDAREDAVPTLACAARVSHGIIEGRLVAGGEDLTSSGVDRTPSGSIYRR